MHLMLRRVDSQFWIIGPSHHTADDPIVCRPVLAQVLIRIRSTDLPRRQLCQTRFDGATKFLLRRLVFEALSLDEWPDVCVEEDSFVLRFLDSVVFFVAIDDFCGADFEVREFFPLKPRES